jgi:hypothetical protein
MYPVSTKQGGAVTAFPDVCQTPTPAGPVPMPYPTAQKAPLSTTRKIMPSPGLVQTKIRPPQPTPAQLKAKLAALHAQLSGLPGGNPNQWHTLVDEYVSTMAALYILLSDQ